MTLSAFLDTPLLCPDDDSVSQVLLDDHDRAAFATIASWTVGELRDHLLADTTTAADLRRLQRAILPEITVPTLVLIGEDDDETPPSYSKAIVDLMPNATLVTIPGAGHLLNLEAPDAVNRAILQFWETT